jgi:non-ribosomal peptide synthase protein (TIGR01720 family)
MTSERARALRRRVDALSAMQRTTLAGALAPDMRETGRLVAFVVADGAVPPSGDAMRAFLANRLSEFMIPAHFIVLDALPRTAAGKLDRLALAREASTAQREPQLPRPSGAKPTELESQLIAIWRDVLKTDDINVADDFFEIGGDSLLSIRVISRAARAGLRISPQLFFERPTIRHIAAALTVEGARTGDGQPAVKEPKLLPDAVGEAPLSPIQHWFVEAVPDHRDWWNQSYVLEARRALDAAQWHRLIGVLVERHAALRLRLACRDGEWRQEFPPADGAVPFRSVTIDDPGPTERTVRIMEEGEREHRSLRLDEGRLFRCVLLESPFGWQRLVLVAHHVVVDHVSWNVIFEDLTTLVAQSLSGDPLRLPPATTSARAWALGLAAQAKMPATQSFAHHWLSMPMEGDAAPADTGDNSWLVAGRHGDAAIVTIRLDAEATRQLVQDAPRKLRSSVPSLLLAALLLAWRRWTGSDILRLDVEGLGRDVLGDAVDVSRTVGWFTTVFPMRLAVPRVEPSSIEPAVDTIITSVQASLDALPWRGAAHGVIRYLSNDGTVTDALAAMPRPVLLFNYLGAHDLTLPPDAMLRVTDEPSGRQRSPDAMRPYPLELNSRVQGGRLIVDIEYSRAAHLTSTIERLATLLRESLLAVCDAPSARTGLAGLDAAALETVADLLGAFDDDGSGQ